MKPIRYAVVGLGHIAQTAMLPAFKHAKKNSVLAALVSSDPVKLRTLARRYPGVATYAYDDFEAALKGGGIDAVYIATPNTEHQRFAELAVRHGVHVLCEKPLAATVDACRAMIESARRRGVKLMTAYRLHFDPGNLAAVEAARGGKLGEPRFFSSVFSLQVRDRDNIRLDAGLGGGTLYDIGIYCINASRYLFRDEPIEVFAMSGNNGERRFDAVDEMTAVTMRFPGDRLASFTCSFGAADSADFDVVGTKGRLRLENAYDYVGGMQLTVEGKSGKRRRSFKSHDQFAPELLYFSECIQKDRAPEPSGAEGLADVRIIEALLESIATRRPVPLRHTEKARRPTAAQSIVRPKVTEPEQVRAHNPSGGA